MIRGCSLLLCYIVLISKASGICEVEAKGRVSARTVYPPERSGAARADSSVFLPPL